MTTRTLGVRTYEMLPRYVRSIDQDAFQDLEKYFEAYDQELAAIEADTILISETLGDSQKAPDSALPRLAYERGLRLPPNDFPNLRRFLANLATFQRWKGNYDLLPAAIFVATQLLVTIEVPWQDDDVWEIGSDVGIGDFSVGYDYRPEPLDTFVIGESYIGEGVWGCEAVNPTLPYEFKIHLLFEPDAERYALLKWVVNTFKRAIDIPIYVVPETTTSWIIGSSRVGVFN